MMFDTRGARAPSRLTWWCALSVALGVLLVGTGHAAQAQQAKKPPQPSKSTKSPQASKSTKPKQTAKPATPQAKAAAAPAVAPVLEARAIELLKASSARLAAAKSMAFTAVISYESQSRFGPPLVFTTKSDVTMQRPDKLRVITFGDGPPTEFYYNGKTMMAFAPAENLVALAEAPPTIDAALKFAFDSAAIYFPFTDFIVVDPYKGIAEGLKLAFYIGQSTVVGGTTTDMVAYADDGVFAQIWIGAEDKLPRRVRAVYLNDPAQMRHQMDLSDWHLDPAVATEFFESTKAAAANRISFASPKVPPMPKAPARAKTLKSPPPKTR